MTRQRLLRVSREVLLTTGAVLGVLCIAMTVVGFAFGVKPLMFRSGSMSPAIETGDLAFARTVDASMLHRGDIVSVVNSSGERITHRLVSAAEQGEARQLRLKGDANQSADAETYTATRADKVMFDLPRLGYVVNAASSPVGVFALGILVALVLMTALRKGPEETDGSDDAGTPRQGRRRSTREPPRRLGKRARVSILTGFAVAMVAVAGPAIAAPWTDTATTTGTRLTAATVDAPASMTCQESGASAVLTFPNADPRYAYVVELASSKTGAAKSTTYVQPSSGSNASTTVSSGFLGGFGGDIYARVYSSAKVGNAYAWKSTEYRGYRLDVSLFFGIVSCNSPF